MSTDLMLPGDELPVTHSQDPTKLAKLAASGFLPYVLLNGSSSGLAKEGKAPMGTYLLMTGKDKFTDLTNSFETLVLAVRGRATRKTMKGILSYFDVDSADFKSIEEESKGRDAGCWYGNEFLLWIRSQRTFATYHAANPTARSAARELSTIVDTWGSQLKAAAAVKENKPAIQNPQAKFTITMVPYNNGHKQHGPIFTRATTPFSEMPNGQDVLDQCKKFAKPASSKVEKVEGVEEQG